MPTEAKRETVAELTEIARSSSAMIVSEYRGLKVSELGAIRRTLRQQNVTYHVVKNRLMKIAAKDAGKEPLAVLLEGPTAVAFGSGNEAVMAKAVIDALRPYRLVKIKGGLLGDHAIVDAAGITSLSQLPSREVLLGQLAGTLSAPMSQLVGALAASMRELAGVMSAVAEQKA
jgi:large subunit ribosomal protein L10